MFRSSRSTAVLDIGWEAASFFVAVSAVLLGAVFWLGHLRAEITTLDRRVERLDSDGQDVKVQFAMFSASRLVGARAGVEHIGEEES